VVKILALRANIFTTYTTHHGNSWRADFQQGGGKWEGVESVSRIPDLVGVSHKLEA
jgi:hypothetical protein